MDDKKQSKFSDLPDLSNLNYKVNSSETVELKIPSNNEMVDHPAHYNNYNIEVLDMMRLIFGVEATINFCELSAFKYRMRAGTKTKDPTEDFKKERWYLDYCKKLQKV